MPNAIGTNEIDVSSFSFELIAAGGIGIPVSFGADGNFQFSPAATSDQISKVQSVYAVHNPQLSKLLAYLANARWLKETGGIVYGSVKVNTDRESQAQLTSAVVSAQFNSSFTSQWKTDSGAFIVLGAPQIIALGLAMSNFVNQCFTIEAQISAQITANPPTVTSSAQIDTIINSIVNRFSM